MIALIVGCAANVWDDVRAAQSLTKFDAVYCVKLSGVHWPSKFKTWATLHPEYMNAYEAQRKELDLPGGYEIVAPLSNEVGQHGKKGNITRRVSYRYKGMNSSASSGIYAAKVALEDGYKCVLAGIPMQDTDGHFLPTTKNVKGHIRGAKWLDRDCFMNGFEMSLPHMRGKVTSMSGLTRKELGIPNAR